MTRGWLGLGIAVVLASGGTAAAQIAPGPAAFERLKSLAGEWETTGDDGDRLKVVYEVVSGGRAVLERVVGVEHGESGMLSVFYLDGDRLGLAHFCTAGNQPRFESVGLEGGELTFTLLPGSVDRSRGHIARAAFRFLDDGRVESAWDWSEPGASHRSIRRQSRVSR